MGYYLDGNIDASVALAKWAMALTDGDDTSEFIPLLRQQIENCIASNENNDSTVIEVLNIFIPAYKFIFQKCASEEEFMFSKEKALIEYSKIEDLLIPLENVVTFFDFVWHTSIRNYAIPDLFANLASKAKKLSALPSLRIYILMTLMGLIMNIGGFSNVEFRPILSNVLTQIEEAKDSVAVISEKLPHFLG